MFVKKYGNRVRLKSCKIIHNKLIGIILFLMIIYNLVINNVNVKALDNEYDTGDNGTLHITNAKELLEISKQSLKNKTIYLQNDIDFETDISWHENVLDFKKGIKPIDISNLEDCTIDGRGYVIRGLFLDRELEDDLALFSVSNIHIKNLIVKYVESLEYAIIGRDNVAGLVANNYGTITNCSVYGNFKGEQNIGGLVCNNYGAISRSYFNGNLVGNMVGGLVAIAYELSIDNCYSYGNIIGKKVGGLIADGNILGAGYIKDCYANMSIQENESVDGTSLIGSFVGYLGNKVTIENCYTTINFPSIGQGENNKLIVFNANEINQNNKLAFDYDEIWFFDYEKSFPSIRNIFVTFNVVNSNKDYSSVLSSRHFYKNEKMALTGFNTVVKEIEKLTIDNENIEFKVLENNVVFNITKSSEIQIHLIHKLQIVTDFGVIENQFIKQGESIIINIDLNSFEKINKVVGKVEEKEYLFSEDSGQYKLIFNDYISEEQEMIVKIETEKNTLFYVIIISLILSSCAVILTLCVFIRRKYVKRSE